MAIADQDFERLVHALRHAETAAEQIGIKLGDSRWVAVVARLDRMAQGVVALRRANRQREAYEVLAGR